MKLPKIPKVSMSKDKRKKAKNKTIDIKLFKRNKGEKPNKENTHNFNDVKNVVFKKGIAQKISLSFMSITLASLLCVGIVTSYKSDVESKSQFVDSSLQILNQNMNYIDFIVSTVENYSMQVFSDSDIQKKLEKNYDSLYEKYTSAESIRKDLNSISLNNTTIGSMYILGLNGIYTGVPDLNTIKLQDKDIKSLDVYKKAEGLNGATFWIPPHINEFNSGGEDVIISNVRMIKSMATSNPLGVLMVNINPEVFQKALSSVEIGKDGYMFIVDEAGNVISHPNRELLGTNISGKPEVKHALESKEGELTYKDKGEKMFSICTSSEKTGWRYIAVVPYKAVSSVSDSIKSIIIIASLICLIFVIGASLKLSKSITKPVIKISEAMDKVEKGDLRVEVNHKSKDEFGQLSKNFNTMVANLRNLVSSVKGAVSDTYDASVLVNESSGQLSVSTTDVSSVIEEIAAGAGDQAQQATNSVDIANNFGGEINSVVNYSNDALGASIKAYESVKDGKKSVYLLKEKSEEGSSVIQEVSGAIGALSENTKEIETILSSITAISEQTNLLSLNAAIEAARAGEAGRGFAVVAEEVRKLAGESKKAADNINTIIKSVNGRTEESVNLAKDIVVALGDQVSYVEKTIEAFDGIEESMETVGGKINNLNISIESINKGKEGIEKSIDGIAAISEETAASTEEVSASVEEQSAYVEELNAMAEKLNVTSQKLKELTDEFII